MPCLPPGDLPNPGIDPLFLMSPALAGVFFLPLLPPGKHYRQDRRGQKKESIDVSMLKMGTKVKDPETETGSVQKDRMRT